MNSSPRSTMRQVAALAGVSHQTVSRYFRPDGGGLLPDTTERVRSAVEALGYRPNVTARRLVTGQTGTISIAVPSIDVPYFGDICRALDRHLRAHHLRTSIDQTLSDRDAEQAVLDQHEPGLVDGVIFHPVALTPEDLVVRQAGFPLVLIGEDPAPHSIDHVMIDNVAAAEEATASLLTSGRRRIAFLGNQLRAMTQTTGQRLAGYKQAIRSAGLKLDRRLQLRIESFQPESGRRAVHAAVERGIRFDALMCRDDMLALGAMHALAELGLRVPEDVAVIGWDNLTIAAHLTPPLTSVAPDLDGIAERATRLMLDRINGYHGPGRHEIVPYRLITRASSAG